MLIKPHSTSQVLSFPYTFLCTIACWIPLISWNPLTWNPPSPDRSNTPVLQIYALPSSFNYMYSLNTLIFPWSYLHKCEIFCQINTNSFNEMSKLVQVMAWCRQATSLYLSQTWPRSMSPYGITRTQRIDITFRYSRLISNENFWKKNMNIVTSQIFHSNYVFHCTMNSSEIKTHWGQNKMATNFLTTFKMAAIFLTFQMHF